MSSFWTKTSLSRGPSLAMWKPRDWQSAQPHLSQVPTETPKLSNQALKKKHPLLQHQSRIFPPSTFVLKGLIVYKTQHALLGMPVLFGLFPESLSRILTTSACTSCLMHNQLSCVLFLISKEQELISFIFVSLDSNSHWNRVDAWLTQLM